MTTSGSSAARVRAYRRRQKEAMRVLRLELYRDQIDLLVRNGALPEADRADGAAVAEAVEWLLDIVFAAVAKGMIRLPLRPLDGKPALPAAAKMPMPSDTVAASGKSHSELS